LWQNASTSGRGMYVPRGGLQFMVTNHSVSLTTAARLCIPWIYLTYISPSFPRKIHTKCTCEVSYTNASSTSVGTHERKRNHRNARQIAFVQGIICSHQSLTPRPSLFCHKCLEDCYDYSVFFPSPNAWISFSILSRVSTVRRSMSSIVKFSV